MPSGDPGTDPSWILRTKFMGSQKLYRGFQLHGGVGASNSRIVQGQLYCNILEDLIKDKA